jgi:hypothetical protein
MYTIEERSHYRRIGACNASHRSRTMHLEAYFDTGSMQSASHWLARTFLQLNFCQINRHPLARRPAFMSCVTPLFRKSRLYFIFVFLYNGCGVNAPYRWYTPCGDNCGTAFKCIYGDGEVATRGQCILQNRLGYVSGRFIARVWTFHEKGATDTRVGESFRLPLSFLPLSLSLSLSFNESVIGTREKEEESFLWFNITLNKIVEIKVMMTERKCSFKK